MHKSLVSDPWYCFLSSHSDCMGMYFSGLVISEFWAGALFDVQFNELVKLLGLKVIIWTQNEHENTYLQTPRINWNILLIKLNHTM